LSTAADEKKKKLIAQSRKAGKPQRTGLGDVNFFFTLIQEKRPADFLFPQGLISVIFPF
jgi:hypothetical protein